MTSVMNTTQYKLWINHNEVIHVFILPEGIDASCFHIENYGNFLEKHGISKVEEWGFITDIVYHIPQVMKSDEEEEEEEEED